MNLPFEPVLSSDAAGWEHVQLALFDQPASYIPEHLSSQHVVCINVGAPVTLAQTIERQRLVEQSVAGDVGIYPAQLLQSFEWMGQAKFLQLYLSPSLLNCLSWELYGRDEVRLLPRSLPADPMILQIAIALQDTLSTQQAGSRLYADSLATTLATHLVYRYSADGPNQKSYRGRLSAAQLKQVKQYIEEHLAEDISLRALADVVQMSVFHFSRLFKRSVGFSPHQYHIQCRMQLAKRLLTQRQLSIAQIAQRIGFSSQSHFNYHFKRIVGMTPTEYRHR